MDASMVAKEDQPLAPPRQWGTEPASNFAGLLSRIIEIQLLQVELQREHIALARQSEQCNKRFASAAGDIDEVGFAHPAKCCAPQVHFPQAAFNSTKPPVVEVASEDALCPSKDAVSPLGNAERMFADHDPGGEGADAAMATASVGTFMFPGHSQRSVDNFSSAPDEFRGEHSDLPESVPTRVRVYLTFLGLLPGDSFTTWRRWLYRCYVCAILLCFVSLCMKNVFLLFLHITSGVGGLPREVVNIAGLGSVTFVWVVFGRALRPKGPMLTLIHDMDRRNFRWQAASSRARRFMVATLLWLMLVSVVTYNNLAAEAQMCRTLADSGELATRSFRSAAPIVCVLISVGTLPIYLFVHSLLLGIVWSLHFFCSLHRHELMWYAYALTNLLANDEDGVDAMQTLHQIEVLVTWRLRHASATWVRAAVIFIASIGAVSVFLISTLLSEPDMSGSEFVRNLTMFILAVVICALWGLPLAQVAEVFDNDVLRHLNNPLVVKAAQRHFGQQLLSHLHTLEWGFRVGQTVINMKMVINLCAVIVVTTVTALSQSILSQLPSK